LASIAVAVAAFTAAVAAMAGVGTEPVAVASVQFQGGLGCGRRATRSLGLPVRDEDFQLQPDIDHNRKAMNPFACTMPDLALIDSSAESALARIHVMILLPSRRQRDDYKRRHCPLRPRKSIKG